ncbi:MAG: hypothetical protein ACI38U_03275 [Corynebacterium sp.]|uniref:hypothetical protein n=1 Tax=Corynebacterium sp. TaxID=1720 RepID=UPI003EFFC55A
MTPETAQTLEPGATPGPWGVERYDGLGAPITNSIGPIMSSCNCDGLYVEDADANLAAAAPDMRAYIATQTWQWGQLGGGGVEWHDTEAGARHHVKAAQGVLVRRPVGPVEVVEE